VLPTTAHVGQLIAGVDPPLETIGAVPVTEVTPPLAVGMFSTPADKVAAPVPVVVKLWKGTWVVLGVPLIREKL